MAVLTTDILLQGFRRDAVFEWLGEPDNHRHILAGAFDDVVENGSGDFTLSFRAPALRKRSMGYRFDQKDDNHGGRRILVKTTGKRTEGNLNYSLRTMKPSKNTLVTLHLDYSPGGILGAVIDAVALREALEGHLKTMMTNLEQAIQLGAPASD
jgi:hypothetical protein